MFKRDQYQKVLDRLLEPRGFMQVLIGPRQVGKTTLIQQVIAALSWSTHFASADEPIPKSLLWIEQQWEIGRLRAKEAPDGVEALLVLDEVQKISGWFETVKRLWDEDNYHKTNLKVVILGSSQLLMQMGLTESLAGRFEFIPITHWSFPEMQKAFNLSLEQYIFFGGYPGAVRLIDDQQRWASYIKNSLIETTISRDILLLSSVKKPVLLRCLFQLGCQYSGQILSFQKMLGQLQDAGNTTTLAHYLDLLDGVGMLTGLQKYAGGVIHQRSSSPKFQVLNNALISAQNSILYRDAKENRDYWGRLVESAIGAHIINSSKEKNINLFYWRERNREVDFILERDNRLVAIEVKSGTKKVSLAGMDAFSKTFKNVKNLLVGGQGIPVIEFLQSPTERWFS